MHLIKLIFFFIESDVEIFVNDYDVTNVFDDDRSAIMSRIDYVEKYEQRRGEGGGRWKEGFMERGREVQGEGGRDRQSKKGRLKRDSDARCGRSHRFMVLNNSK